MNDDNLPTINNNDQNEQSGINKFHIEVNKFEHFMIQNKDEKDYGKDYEIELISDNKKATNLRVHCQIKGTKEKLNKDESLSFQVYSNNISYLYKNNHSLYLCYHIPTDTLFVKDVDEVVDDLFKKYGNKWHQINKPTIKFSKIFDENYQKKLKNILISKSENREKRKLAFLNPDVNIKSLIKNENFQIEVSKNSENALKQLIDLVNDSQDCIVSNYFNEFEKVFENENEFREGMCYLYV